MVGKTEDFYFYFCKNAVILYSRILEQSNALKSNVLDI